MAPRSIRYLLIADGSSDACLTRPIEWLLRAQGCEAFEGEWADLRTLPEPPSLLTDRLRIALDYYAGELIFVHRDAEHQSVEDRVAEISAAIAGLGRPLTHVCIVPVRMTEAWLLHDERAIRVAAGKPNGKQALGLPSLKQLEGLADPKAALRDALLTASEASGRKLKQTRRDFGRMRHRVAELIDDYAPLRALPAFARFEQDLQTVLGELEQG